MGQFYLASAYAKGQGVAKDNAEAARWYRKAAEQNHAGARHYLRLLCLSAQGRYTLPSSCNGGLGTLNPN
ncbi:MAG: SEL1-like repeat protein [Proteobacteria bacterium]|nr:SEL1-like repeat protein [Pseudomonadota bacterium]